MTGIKTRHFNFPSRLFVDAVVSNSPSCGLMSKQTYCDPKAFAWQHEFVAFNKMAKEDQFGEISGLQAEMWPAEYCLSGSMTLIQKTKKFLRMNLGRRFAWN